MTAAASAMPATITTLPVGTQLPAKASGSTTLDESDFLRLLTTQLQNQDPLDPANPTEFAAELAQFSTATGVQSLNSAMAAANGLQAAGFVGHNVAVAGNALILGQNGAATGGFNLSAAAGNVMVAIADPAGNIVRTLNLGAMAAGAQGFSWDGQSAAGAPVAPANYTFAVNAVSAAGAPVSTTSYAVVPVTAVSFGGSNGPLLDLGGGVGAVPVSAVQQLF